MFFLGFLFSRLMAQSLIRFAARYGPRIGKAAAVGSRISKGAPGPPKGQPSLSNRAPPPPDRAGGAFRTYKYGDDFITYTGSDDRSMDSGRRRTPIESFWKLYNNKDPQTLYENEMSDHVYGPIINRITSSATPMSPENEEAGYVNTHYGGRKPPPPLTFEEAEVRGANAFADLADVAGGYTTHMEEVYARMGAVVAAAKEQQQKDAIAADLAKKADETSRFIHLGGSNYIDVGGGNIFPVLSGGASQWLRTPEARGLGVKCYPMIFGLDCTGASGGGIMGNFLDMTSYVGLGLLGNQRKGPNIYMLGLELRGYVAWDPTNGTPSPALLSPRCTFALIYDTKPQLSAGLQPPVTIPEIYFYSNFGGEDQMYLNDVDKSDRFMEIARVDSICNVGEVTQFNMFIKLNDLPVSYPSAEGSAGEGGLYFVCMNSDGTETYKHRIRVSGNFYYIDHESVAAITN